MSQEVRRSLTHIQFFPWFVREDSRWGNSCSFFFGGGTDSCKFPTEEIWCSIFQVVPKFPPDCGGLSAPNCAFLEEILWQ